MRKLFVLSLSAALVLASAGFAVAQSANSTWRWQETSIWRAQTEDPGMTSRQAVAEPIEAMLASDPRVEPLFERDALARAAPPWTRVEPAR